MTDELVFRVEIAVAQAAAPISLAEAGLTVRAHLQEWVLAHPAILGEDVMVVTSELGSWRSQTGALADRLDVLGLDRDSRVKRNRGQDTVEVKAIKYSAIVSRFTPEVLASQHAHFAGQRGEAIGRAGLLGSEGDGAPAWRRNAPANTVIDMRHGGIEREEPAGDDGNGARGGDA